MEEPKATTETGINVATYTADRDAGVASLTKPVKASANYVYMKATHTVGLVDGKPAVVEGPPQLLNVNRQSVADLRAQLARQQNSIEYLLDQLAAMESDMDKLDKQK